MQLAGLNPEPPPDPDPDAFVTNAWWSAGGFEPASGPLLRDHLDFAMDMNIGGEIGPWRVLFTASAK